MKILSLKTKNTYEVSIKRSGENSQRCPECADIGKHNNVKSFSFNAVKGVGQCFSCQAKFVEFKQTEPKKAYVLPEWKNKTKLTEKSVMWFRGRGIMDETLNLMDVSSSTEFMSQTNKDENVICFPYYKDKKLINIKFRDAQKHFKLCKDAELIFYNFDAIYINTELVIVEGEIDCLSMMQSGIKNVISVPNGASATNLDYIDSSYGILEAVEKFYIAVDNDEPGLKLRTELIRRLGAERCYIVDFGDCKDANEYLQKHGAFELGGILATATEVPVDGVIYLKDIEQELNEYYKNGLQRGKTIQLEPLDNLITWDVGRLLTVTGIPSHGKSSFIKYLVSRLNCIYGWKCAFYDPETYPPALFYSLMSSMISGKSFNEKYLQSFEHKKTIDYVSDNFFLIYPENDLSVDNILIKARHLVRKHGVKVLVLDPYNQFEHLMNHGESETLYISRFLDKLRIFAKQNDCLVVLIAHPTKMQKSSDGMAYQIPTLYDISGSAHFYNKTDFGLTVYRDFVSGMIKIVVTKVKFRHLGQTGEIDLEFDFIGGRYFPKGVDHDHKTYISRSWESAEQETMFEVEQEPLPF